MWSTPKTHVAINIKKKVNNDIHSQRIKFSTKMETEKGRLHKYELHAEATGRIDHAISYKCYGRIDYSD